MDTPAWQSIQSKLPTVCESISDIFQYCTKPGSEKMNTTVNQYTSDLVDHWTKSFGKNHVLSISTVKKKLMKLVKTYHNQVYIKAHRSSGKKKDVVASKESLRRLNESWKKANNVLFDIGKDMAGLEPSSNEAIFYAQQLQPNREGRVTDDVDEEYVEELRQEQEQDMEEDAIELETEDMEVS